MENIVTSSSRVYVSLSSHEEWDSTDLIPNSWKRDIGQAASHWWEHWVSHSACHSHTMTVLGEGCSMDAHIQVGSWADHPKDGCSIFWNKDPSCVQLLCKSTFSPSMYIKKYYFFFFLDDSGTFSSSESWCRTVALLPWPVDVSCGRDAADCASHFWKSFHPSNMRGACIF